MTSGSKKSYNSSQKRELLWDVMLEPSKVWFRGLVLAVLRRAAASPILSIKP